MTHTHYVELGDVQAFAETFLEELQPREDQATIVGLIGELGAGKTTFMQCIARELKIEETVTSPTFVIEKRYQLPDRTPPFDTLIHIDAYRLSSGKELELLHWDEDMKKNSNLIMIEWPEHVKEVLPKNITTLSFTVVDKETRSIIHHES